MVKDKDYLDKLRHSAAHLLAAAVTKLWPKALPTIGPSIENGFYYDFDNLKISDADLPKIETEMKKIVKTWDKFERLKISEPEAKKKYKDNKYKLELIDEFEKEGQEITLYKSGDFVDLCRGGHVDSPAGELKHFKLLSIAGAYWRGSEKNKMLTRIYGTAFATKKELNDYLKMLEEAKKRDHRKLGRELDLFAFSKLVGAGLPLYTPKGTTIIKELYQALLDISKKYGVQEVQIPHMAKPKLYEFSGHAEKFSDELLRVESRYGEFVLKPVNCPHHTQIYASKLRSYRDLPIRYMESTQQHRDEKPGEIGGLTRTRSFKVDDGHTFCTLGQVKKEATNLCKIIEEFYKGLGLWGNHWVSLSVRSRKDFLKYYIGDKKDWDKAEKILEEIAKELNLGAKRMEGEAAIYGSKIDYMFKDALGNDRQLATVQIDFAMPQRFGLKYVSKNGQNKTPVMIHRAILGSYERFLAILIEHFEGAFPVWLSPIQVNILPITKRSTKYAHEIYEKLLMENIRVEVDIRNETLQAKIRDAQLEKIPYMMVIGDREESKKKVTIRLRDETDLGQMSLEKFVKKVKDNISSKSLRL